MPASSMTTRVSRADRAPPSRAGRRALMDQVSLARVSVVGAGLLAQDGGGGGGRGEPEDGAAVLGPGRGQGPHGGGLAGPGGGDRQLEPGAGGGHRRGPGRPGRG